MYRTTCSNHWGQLPATSTRQTRISYLFSPLSAHSRCPVLVSAELSQALMTTFPEWRPFFFGMWRLNLTKFSFLDVVQFCSCALLLLMWALRQYATIGHWIIRVSIFKKKISFICWCCANDTCEPEDVSVFADTGRSCFQQQFGQSVSFITILSFSTCRCVFWLICLSNRHFAFKWGSNVSYFVAAVALIKAVCKNQIFSLIGQWRLCKQWNLSRPSWQGEAWSALRTVAVWQRWMRVCRAGLAALLSPPPPPSSPLLPHLFLLALLPFKRCSNVG